MGSTSPLLSVRLVAAPASRAVCTALTPALPHLIKSEGERDRKFADSLLKGTGFETAVPRKVGARSRSPLVAPVTVPVSRLWQPFWKELRRLGDAEAQNLTSGGIPARSDPRATVISLARSSTGIRT